MKQSSIIVRPSKIRGRGIFVTKRFRKGQQLFTAEGPVIVFTKPTHWRLGPHWLNVGKDRWLVPSANSLWRFINHSCEPNAILTTRRKIIALTSIQTDEEITLDYSFTEAHRGWHMACHCGAKDCRKTIRSIHSLPETLFRKHRQYVQPFLRKEYAKNKVEVLKKGSEHTVVAKRRLRKGEMVYKVEGPVIFYKQPPNYRLGYRWLGTGVNSWMIPEEHNPWNSMKHSCDPNVGLNDDFTIVTLRSIHHNEELTIDNSITEADPRWRMKCSCGAKNCRATIRSIQFLPKETYKKYLPYIPSFLQEIYQLR